MTPEDIEQIRSAVHQEITASEERTTKAIHSAHRSVTTAIANATTGAELRELQRSAQTLLDPLEPLTRIAKDGPPPDAQQALINARLDAIEAAAAHQLARLDALEARVLALETRRP